VLEAKDVNQFYGGSHILWDATLTLEPGACTCLMGRNGVGKTTFLKVAMGLLPARSGSLKLDGEELLGRPAELRARLGIGYVPQGREIFPQLDVEENLRIGLVARGKKSVVPEKVFALFPVLKKMLHRRGGDLSGGQQQQLAIGRALVMRPRLLLLDEPTEGIQPSIIKDIGRAITYLRSLKQIAIVLVEQYLDFASELGDRFFVMDRGAIVYSVSRANMDEAALKNALAI
jgi:urea transport system ATP-binding protein